MLCPQVDTKFGNPSSLGTFFPCCPPLTAGLTICTFCQKNFLLESTHINLPESWLPAFLHASMLYTVEKGHLRLLRSAPELPSPPLSGRSEPYKSGQQTLSSDATRQHKLEPELIILTVHAKSRRAALSSFSLVSGRVFSVPLKNSTLAQHKCYNSAWERGLEGLNLRLGPS